MTSPLIIRFGTDIEPARRGIASLTTSITTTLSQLDGALSNSAGHTSAFLGVFAAMQAPLDGVLNGMARLQALSNVVTSIGTALDDANGRMERSLQIATGARDLGVGRSFFQTLTLQARDLGVEAGVLTGLLAKARDAAAVKLGVGKDAKNQSAIQDILGQHVAAGNITAGDKAEYDAQRSQEGRIRAVLDLMEKLQEAGRRLAAEDIGRAFFGDDFDGKSRAGIALIEALRRGLAGADVAGGVRIVSDEEIERTQRMQAKVAEINDLYARGMKPILDDIAALQDRASEASLEWQLRVAKMVVSFGEYYQLLKNAAADALAYARQIGQQIGILSPDEDKGKAGGEDAPLVVKVKPRPAKPDTSKPRPGHGGGGGSSGSEDVDAVEAMIRALNKARDVQLAELEAVEKTVIEREKLLALARAGAAARDDFERGRRGSPTLDDDERRRVLAGAEALGRAKAATKDLEQAQMQAADAARYFGDAVSTALGDAILDGKSLADVLSGLGRQMSRSALQALFTGQGPLAGLLGTAPAASEGASAVGGAAAPLNDLFKGLFGGFRANGGPVRAGRAYTVGEIGRELFVPDRDGSIVPVRPAASVGGGAGASAAPAPVVVQMRVESPDVGGFLRSEAQVTAALARAVQRGTRSL